MNDPIKIIFRFKNNNKRIQHHIYIYIGKVPRTITAVLNKIQKLSLYDCLSSLTKIEYDRMEKYYGQLWYKKFYNTYHTQFTIGNILKTAQYKKELTNKYGKKWFEKHISEHKLSDKMIYYTYEAVIKDEIIRKELRKKKLPIKEDADVMINYKTTKALDISSMTRIPHMKRSINSDTSPVLSEDSLSNLSSSIFDSNSSYDSDDEDYNEDHYDFSNVIDIIGNTNMDASGLQYGGQVIPTVAPEPTIPGDDDKDGIVEFEEGLEFDDKLEGEEFELEELEKLYQNMDVDIDKNIKKTSELIKKALKDEKILKKTKTKMIEFDVSKDQLMHDDRLMDNYMKFYVTTQYIFKDDSIKKMKDKIACSIKNNIKFGRNSYIIPSRQYLWSEYYFKNKVEKVMIGQKWIKRTSLLHIDIEPSNNLRIYEELKGNLRLLKNNIKRYGGKIRREDDDHNILYDYDKYYTNNEIYMRDVYNDFGLEYSPDSESLRNIGDVYVGVYYPRINKDDIKYIISYLNNDRKIEYSKMESIYENINNDLILENQIMQDVEDTKKNLEYKKLFKDNYVTQSAIHVNLKLVNNTKINLARIFDKFATSNKYPFIQYQTPDGQIIFKYSDKDIFEFAANKENKYVLSKWFGNAPYGISFKVRILDRGMIKFMAINLTNTGRVEFKDQWKESDKATISDIKKTYNYLKNLLRKLNKEDNKVKIEIPEDHDFKYAFINTIQRFVLPNNFIRNDNDLSEFSRYFFPYVALVIKPRKRKAKIKKAEEESKFGTYLRYKRVSKYEDRAKIERMILYFMRNYDYNDKSLANVIAIQFNITMENAINEIERVKAKYPKIKRSRRILKKLENIPKYKPPGIGIDIQGKDPTKYKIRISGVRTEDQLDRIITFLNILIYLYVETYHYKRPERKRLLEKLKKLTNIAHRRNKVADLVDRDPVSKKVKHMIQLDKRRIGFKPEKGQMQWTRSCQNSGKDKRRRPQIYTDEVYLHRKGFKINKKTGVYERKVKIKKNKKTKEIIIRAIELKSTGDGEEDKTVYYACDPDKNGEHFNIGFLSRGNNPYGKCMPCCFKKDGMISKNKSKRDYFMKCVGDITIKKRTIPGKTVGDILYVLQDTNKIQEGRIGFMPKYLDFFFNQMLKKKKDIKRHYLISTKTGYYFKYGVNQREFPFLNAVASTLNTTVSALKKQMITKLVEDKTDKLYTALNNGNIKTQFGERENYIKFIKKNNLLDFDFFSHILSIPGVVSKHGLNIIVFNKKQIVIKKVLEKVKIRTDFVLLCQNSENVDNILDKNRNTLFIIKDYINYNPIVLVVKKDEEDKDMNITKLFKYDTVPDNIINHIKDYYMRNCKESIFKDIRKKKNTMTAKELYAILNKLGINEYSPKYQIIDSRNKCKYIISKNLTIIPVIPSGSIYNLSITKTFENKLLNVTDMIKNLNKLYELSKKKIHVKPVGLYYDIKTNIDANIHAIMTISGDIVPIINEKISINWIKKQGYSLEHTQLYDKIDEEIAKEKKKYIIDDRIKQVNYEKYYNESYELFRLEFSEYINSKGNENLKKRIYNVIKNNDMNYKEKRHRLRLMIYKLIDNNLYNLYKTLNNHQVGGKFIHVLSKKINTSNYEINNNRSVCNIHNTANECNTSHHCHWSHNKCKLAITKEMVINFVNKICVELGNNSLKASELLMKGDYFVSDIVDLNRYTERKGQTIIRSTNFAINKVLESLFGKGNIPIIGKRRRYISKDVNYLQMNENFLPKDMGYFYIQEIIDNNLSIYRAYANVYYWVKQKYYDISSRNLGYYSILQTNLANYFKSIVIDWLVDKNNIPYMTDIKPYMNLNENDVYEYITKIGGDITTSTNCIPEMFILNIVYNIPIYVYNDNNVVMYIFDNGLVYDINRDGEDAYKHKKYNKYRNKTKIVESIVLQFTLYSGSIIPARIDAIYYK